MEHIQSIRCVPLSRSWWGRINRQVQSREIGPKKYFHYAQTSLRPKSTQWLFPTKLFLVFDMASFHLLSNNVHHPTAETGCRGLEQLIEFGIAPGNFSINHPIHYRATTRGLAGGEKGSLQCYPSCYLKSVPGQSPTELFLAFDMT